MYNKYSTKTTNSVRFWGMKSTKTEFVMLENIIKSDILGNTEYNFVIYTIHVFFILLI